VVAVGPDALEELREGRYVLYPRQVGTRVELDDEELVVMRDTDVVGLL
jgi:co-chaperonin GroES (HSP10)